MIRVLILILAASLICSAEVTYRVRLTANEGNRVVTLPAEQYVAAVLAGEASTFHDDEALKAMAVAARTYAARLRGRHAAEGFDFCATTHCQRVDLSGITSRLASAARATAGEILWFDGKPAFSVYTRSCGGETEAGSAVWPDLEAPYLRVRSDPYCIRSGREKWTWSGTPQQIVVVLKASGLQFPENLDSIAIVHRTTSGRAKTLRLEGQGTVLINAGSLRFAIGRNLGWNTLRSERYEVQTYGGRIHFRGSGEGHGVGLCQRGADEMASEGLSYREILAFYYPGTTVGITARGFEWTRLGGDGVVVLTMQPDSGRKVLSIAEDLRRKWESRLGWPAVREITIRVYPDIDSFRNATGEPGWIAARTSGRTIDLQPVEVLESRGVLRPTLQHELVHAMVGMHAAPGLPVWFREGVVEWLVRGGADSQSAVSRLVGTHELLQRQDRTTAERAYGVAEARVGALAARYGADAVLTWVARGLPVEVKNSSDSSAATNSR
jgi:stage II sporulation protein D